MSEPASAPLTNTWTPEEIQGQVNAALEQEVNAHNDTKRQREELRVEVQKLKTRCENLYTLAVGYKRAWEDLDDIVTQDVEDRLESMLGTRTQDHNDDDVDATAYP